MVGKKWERRTDPPKDLGELLQRVGKAVEDTSLRHTARQIGISPTGLTKVLAGNHPYAPTMKRLRKWAKSREAP